jgi:hypothetical protein
LGFHVRRFSSDFEAFRIESTGAIFKGASSEYARIDSSGRLLVGTSSAQSVSSTGLTPALQLNSSSSSLSSSALGIFANSASNNASVRLFRNRATTAGGFNYTGGTVQTNDVLGLIDFLGVDAGATPIMRTGATIQAVCEDTPTTTEMPTRLVFSTTADGASSPTERMRIGANGAVRIDSTVDDPGSNSNSSVSGLGHLSDTLYLSKSGGEALHINRFTSDGTAIAFRRTGTQVGTISVTTSATAYNTSSDYRLKENVVPLTGAADRVNQLQVHRFNFIADPDTTVDGFIAHEAQAVVPECVTGTKDEVDADGSPVYQGIDQSKLVPLLTAALQEALAKIETLEARLTAAGI